jgi:hypothetical protein
MLPIVGVPETIRRGMAPYRDVFCRDAGFEHISRYVTGLLLSPKKTLQGLYDVQVWESEHAPSRRAMHAAVFEAGWDAEALRPRQRAVIAQEHRGRGRAVLSLAWTYAHHERGPKIWGINKAWDHVEKRMALDQPVVTAVIANRACLDGGAVIIQQPHVCAEEMAYVRETVQDSYEQMAQVRGRLLELCHHLTHRRAYKKRTEIALESARQLEGEGHFPQANYAFDNGLLTLELTRCLERAGKHWGSDVEGSRHIQWYGQWCRVDTVAATLRQEPPRVSAP